MKPEPTTKDSSAKGLAIYVHWPFCLAKCPYCDFNSHVRDDLGELDQSAWTAAYIKDLRHDLVRLKKDTGPATSLFFGGGTPSLMTGKTVAAIIDDVENSLGFSADAEITLEANPTSVEATRFRDYVSAGVNRFSLGVQALRDDDLKALGRQHSVAEALAAVEVARRHCENISFDLIYARSGQKLADWQIELNEALEFAPTHLSLYQLTIERGTRFFERWKQGDLILPDEDLASNMFDLTNAACASQGLAAYEVSNYARPGFESRHNISYWQSDPYIGIGPGAHGRLDCDQGRLATTRLRSPEKWLARVTEQGHGTETEEAVSGDALVAEVLMMGLRLMSGLTETRFKSLTGKTFAQALPAEHLDDLIDGGFVTLDNNVLAATAQGRNVLNVVTEKLLT
ncbi:MAG: coproporphyrinogen III oxidase [Alphaproteobacteria bacterium]|nr:coproporphyrinogen III oxidase [Alphaproteobacteria bacterium]